MLKKTEVSVSRAANITGLHRNTILKYIGLKKISARPMGEKKKSWWLVDRQSLEPYARPMDAAV